MAWPDTTTNPAPARAWSVAALLLAVADALAARLGAVTVRGEISGFTRAASGHCYFSLKDSDGQQALLRCAMFRRAAGHERVVCEVNADPPNPVSDAFHAALGFAEVGSARLSGTPLSSMGKTVRYFSRPLTLE